MGILNALWKSYQNWQDEKESSSDYDDYEPSYPDRGGSSLPRGYARIQWQGYYIDYENHTRYCSGVEGVCEMGLAQRILNNENNSAIHWLRKVIPDFYEAESNAGAFPWIVESNY